MRPNGKTLSGRIRRRMVTNANLQSARTARDDEFYTKYADVDAELSHYMPDLKGCRVYCGADGPEKHVRTLDA